ncbi:MAG: histidine ammonia-lyase [Enterococcus sp.]
MQIVTIDGQNLTSETIQAVARGQVQIEIDGNAWQKVQTARNFVLSQLEKQTVYGFNTGVGQNKDQTITLEAQGAFNRDLIYAHLIAVGEIAEKTIIRATMLIKANAWLRATTGIQPAVIRLLVDCLNHDILPQMKVTGSIGEADLGPLAAIGMLLLGEGEVFYQNQPLTCAVAFAQANLQPVQLGPKDGLSIVSSNAYSQAFGMLTLQKVAKLLGLAEKTFALVLEAIDGNVTPFSQQSVLAKNHEGQKISAQAVRSYLQGSYLLQEHPRKSVQDPLSFRDAVSVFGATREALTYVTTMLVNDFNHSDDNPLVDLSSEKILTTANYETTHLALAFEMLNNALAHLARLSVFRVIKMGDADLTGLPRFLAVSPAMFGFQTLQKTAVAKDIEIQQHAQSISKNFYPLAGMVEDHATNLAQIITNTQAIVTSYDDLLAIELLHATQALNLRFENPKASLGTTTKELFCLIRSVVPFFEQDRPLAPAVEQIKQALKSSCG